MTAPVFGIQFNLIDDAPTPEVFADFSVLGIVLPSDDANSTIFPLNTPVDINTGDATVLVNAGTGPLYKCLLAVNNQLGPFQVSARAVVVRVAQGGNTAETMANIIGSPSAQTGIYALLKAPHELGVTPRLIGAPGYTGQVTYAGGTITVTRAPGRVGGNTGTGNLNLASPAYVTGYQVGAYTVTCIGGATSGNGEIQPGGNVGGGSIGSITTQPGTTLGVWRIKCNTTVANGGLFAVFQPNGTFDGIATAGITYSDGLGLGFIISASGTDFTIGDGFDIAVSEVVPHAGGVFSVADPYGALLGEATVGTPYSNQIAFTITAGGTDYQIGDLYIVTVAQTGGQLLANPLCAALPEVLNALLASAIVGGPSTSSKTDAIVWQTTLASQRLLPVDNEAIIENLTGTGTEFQDLAAQALGVAVAVDFSHQGFPFWSFANQPIQGILGLKRPDSFSLLDGATDAQELLAAGVGCAVRGDHSDASLTDSGWSLIMYQNASTDPQWTLFNKTRGRDFMHLQLLRAIRHHLGRENITPHDVQLVLQDMEAVLSDLRARDCVIGWQIGFDPSVNTPADLRAGSFRVFVNAEEPAPILLVTVDSGLDFAALVAEIATLATETATG